MSVRIAGSRPVIMLMARSHGLRTDTEGDPPSGLVKRFDGWKNNVLQLWQHNPAKAVPIAGNKLISIHSVVMVQLI